MSYYADIVSGGIWPLQHNDPQYDAALRIVRFAARMSDVPDGGVPSGYTKTGALRPERDSHGDILGPLLWRQKAPPVIKTTVELDGLFSVKSADPRFNYTFSLTRQIASTKAVASNINSPLLGGRTGDGQRPTTREKRPPDPRDILKPRDIPAWWFAAPAVVIDDPDGDQQNGVTFAQAVLDKMAKDAGGLPVAPRAFKAASLQPIVKPPGNADFRFEPIQVSVVPGTLTGQRGVVVNCSNEFKQDAVFLPAAEPIRLVNFEGEPSNATLVFEQRVVDNGDGTLSEEVDPLRFARMHSFWRVVRPKPGEDLFDDFHHPESNCLAWQLTFAGRDALAGYGLVVDVPSTNTWTQEKHQPGTQEKPGTGSSGSIGGVGAGGGSGGNPQAGYPSGSSPPLRNHEKDAYVGELIWRYPGIHYDIVQLTRNDQAFKSAPFSDLQLYRVDYRPQFGSKPGDQDKQDKPEDTPKTQERKGTQEKKPEAAKTVIASMTWTKFGPINSGGPGCPHKIGETFDGEDIFSAHIDTDAYFRSSKYDGPLYFEDRIIQKVDPLPLLARAHLVWNPDLKHSHTTGEKNGRWWIVSETSNYKTPTGRGTTGGAPGGGTTSRISTTDIPDGPPSAMCSTSEYSQTPQSWIASPFQTMTSGLILRAQDYTLGAKDYRAACKITEDDLNIIDDAPVVMRFQVYGRKNGGEWDKTQQRGEGNFIGGTGRGGLYIGPGEIDVKDIINERPPARTWSSTHVLFSTYGGAVGYGEPEATGEPKQSTFRPFVSMPKGTTAGHIPQSNGNTDVNWVAPSSLTGAPGYFGNKVSGSSYTLTSNETMTTDRLYGDLNLNGFDLDTNGFRLFVNGTLTSGGGHVQNNGNNGANGTGTGGAGGAAKAAAVLGTSAAGGAGGNIGVGGFTGLSVASAGLGGNGGNGGAGGFSASSGGTVTAPTASMGNLHAYATAAHGGMLSAANGLVFANGGAGGGGGSGATGGDATGGGGGGGGGVVLVVARTIATGTTVGCIRANGGNGGNGNSISGGQGGGGGGGGGGCVIVIYGSKTGTGTFTANGGTGGTGAAGGGNGVNGSAGTVLEITG